MARTNTLGNFLTDVADAIRTKKGSEEPIAAADFDTEIENLPSGGGDLSEYFNNTITENRAGRIQWDYLKKIPDLIVANNVTQLSYLFDKDYFTVNGQNSQIKVPKVVCGDNVTKMSSMYKSNSSDFSLTVIDLSGLNTSNVTTMQSMFENRKGLTSLDFSTFDFSRVETIGSMFNNCTGLTSLDLSNFIGQSLKSGNYYSLNSTFKYCTSLTKIDLSNLAPVNVMDCRSMFIGCNKLEEIDLDKWDLATKATSGNSTSIFYNCGSLLESGIKTKVYVKDQASQDWILALSSSDRPSSWSTDNVIIAGSEADLRNA